MPITRTAWTDDDGTGTTGTPINNSEKTILYNQIDAFMAATISPSVVDIPFNAANYTALAPMTWTVGASNAIANWYSIVGRLILWDCEVTQSIVGGSPATNLFVKIPAGLVSPRYNWSVGRIYAPSTGWIEADARVIAGDSRVTFFRKDSANLTLGETWIHFQMWISIT